MPQFKYLGEHVRFVGDYSGGYECINNGDFYEKGFLEHIRSMGLRGVYLDIGTNIGNHLLYFAKFCPSERVIGFEPVAHWRARAWANIEANQCQGKVEVRPHGLLDVRTQLEFNPYGTPYVLDCLTLDEAVGDLKGVSFVKMDIEGSEPRALLGAKAFFRNNRPLLFAECMGNPDSLLAAAGQIGYAHTGVVFPGTPMLEFKPVEQLG